MQCTWINIVLWFQSIDYYIYLYKCVQNLHNLRGFHRNYIFKQKSIMAASAKMSFNYYQNGKYGTLPLNPQKDAEVTGDMHLKMSKKIAQLTKVNSCCQISYKTTGEKPLHDFFTVVFFLIYWFIHRMLRSKQLFRHDNLKTPKC